MGVPRPEDVGRALCDVAKPAEHIGDGRAPLFASVEGNSMEGSTLRAGIIFAGRKGELEFIGLAPGEAGNGKEVAAHTDLALELRQRCWCGCVNLEANLLPERGATVSNCARDYGP